MRKIYLILTLTVFLVPVLNTVCFGGWLVFSKPAFKGKIIDAEAKQPIEGAVVTAVYYSQTLISGPGGGSTKIIKIQESLTDEKGEFTIPAYTTLINPNSLEAMTYFTIFKSGYGSYPNFSVEPRKSIKYLNWEFHFTQELGTKREVKKDSETVTIKNGVVELPRLNTWDERRKAAMISISDIPKEKWPILNEMVEKEIKWVNENRGWRSK